MTDTINIEVTAKPRLCLHCEQVEIKDGSLCEVCAKYAKCACCQVIFGKGISKPSKKDLTRCESCVDLEENIDFFCKGCGAQLPIYFSTKTSTLHYVVRGNYCGQCNNACAIEARRALSKEPLKEFTGYLAILMADLGRGLSQSAFDEAVELNPHDVVRQPIIKEDIDL